MAKKTQKARKVGRTAAKVSKAQVQKESARLEEVDKELQARMDQPYVAGLTVHRLRFMEGEDVVVLIDGLYFRGLVRHHYRLIPSLYPHSNDIHFRIPTYTISFDGFNQNNDAEIAENELISRDGSDAVAVFGMLYAHFWNELWRKWQGKELRARDGLWCLVHGPRRHSEPVGLLAGRVLVVAPSFRLSTDRTFDFHDLSSPVFSQRSFS
ncbi:hypothetical protein RvY_13910-1 [Ramazzottius varieornatus]|uniref:Uncharacterized protein n=1 Tax=Ramazzottius varieornatus TaxID=947166 RepID=A0A1D1VPJ8_RAMVA|nr:hypothetical protein RvY_13910-1 [Ramazzottius varieornatus]